jgi:Bacteriophage HK97-gp10, putative tail-component
MPTPGSPMPPFVGSFISVNGMSLIQHQQQARQIGINIQKVAEDDLDAAMAEWMSLATTLVPVVTGYLRSSIYISKIGRFEYRFGAFADYAHYVEYGTGTRVAKPFLTPGIIRMNATLPGLLLQDVSKAMMGP